MKNIALLISFLFTSAVGVFAQQEAQFTQFMHYRMGYNPGFAGSNETAEVSALIRSQWLGLDGAPTGQLITFNMPLVNDRVGIGANFSRQSVGVTSQLTADGAYAYRLKVPRGYLGLGVQASVRYLRVDYSKLEGTQAASQDEAIAAGLQSKLVPNFGAGVYYDAENFYLGFSVPRLLANNIDFGDGDDLITREVQHAYLMVGFDIPLSDELVLQPNLLLKYVKDAPFDGDINVMLEIMNRFEVGTSYRLGGSTSGIGEAISLLLGAKLNETLFFGLAYDATMSDLREYNSGSVEGVFRYSLQGESKGEDVDSPRGFF